MATTQEQIRKEAERKRRLGKTTGTSQQAGGIPPAIEDALSRLTTGGSPERAIQNIRGGTTGNSPTVSPTGRLAQQRPGSVAPVLTPPSDIASLDIVRRRNAADGTTQGGADPSGTGVNPSGTGARLEDGGQSFEVPGAQDITKTVTNLGGGQSRATFTGGGINEKGVAELTGPTDIVNRQGRGTFSVVGSVTGKDSINNPEGERRGQPVLDFINQRFQAQVDSAQENRKRVLGEIRRRDALELAAEQNKPIERLIEDIRSGREKRLSVTRQLGELERQVSENRAAALGQANTEQRAEIEQASLETAREKEIFNRSLALSNLDANQQKEIRNTVRQESLDNFNQFIQGSNLDLNKKKQLGETLKDAGKKAEEVSKGTLEISSAVEQVKALLLSSGIAVENIRRIFPDLTDEELGLTEK